MNEKNAIEFGRMSDGTPVEELTLTDGSMSCNILTYGGALRALTVPDRAGRPVDVALGLDTLEDYLAQDKYLGALVGRCANRIAGRSASCGPTTAPTTSMAVPPASIKKSGRSGPGAQIP